MCIRDRSQVVKEAELAQVVLSEITSSVKMEPNLEVVSEQNVGLIPESGEVISLEIKESDESDEIYQVKTIIKKGAIIAPFLICLSIRNL